MEELTIKDGDKELGIFEKAEDAWTTSVDLARIFEKRHDNVLRDIKKIIDDCSDNFGALNFGDSYYKSQQGKRIKMYRMNRKGFTLVAMGFTGKKAMAFKEAYINAFENMQSLIETRVISKGGYKAMSKAIYDNIGNKGYIYAKEADMINQIVLGMKSSDFKELYGLKKGETPRDAVVVERLERLDKAQRLNGELINAGLNFEQRQRIINKNYGSRERLQ